MKRLILVRHGKYGPDMKLDDLGRKQIEKLSNILKTGINGDQILILASVKDRAKESAEIIGKIFGVEVETHEVLCEIPENLSGVLELVRAKKNDADIIFLVTHLEYVEAFPCYFGEQEFGISTFPYTGVNKGEAWDIDCEQKTITHVSPSFK